jgi:NAD(P)-dependent dehydrogenase (short-subunit alcohol dehydrogenase family)
MRDKICIVTGANSGIGKATALGLAQAGATVGMVCRSAIRGQRAMSEIMSITENANLHLFVGDLGYMEDVRQVARSILSRFNQVDVLVNNAGVFLASRHTTRDGYEATFAINHLGYFLLTHLLLDRIKATPGARIINVSSASHLRGVIDFSDLHYERRFYNGLGAYRQSKLANLLFTYELARRLQGTGVTANAMNPGFVYTNMGNGSPARWLFWLAKRLGLLIDPAAGAKTALYLAGSPEVDGISGRYFYRNRPISSSEDSNDMVVASRLWELSLTLTGLKG